MGGDTSAGKALGQQSGSWRINNVLPLILQPPTGSWTCHNGAHLGTSPELQKEFLPHPSPLVFLQTFEFTLAGPFPTPIKPPSSISLPRAVQPSRRENSNMLEGGFLQQVSRLYCSHNILQKVRSRSLLAGINYVLLLGVSLYLSSCCLPLMFLSSPYQPQYKHLYQTHFFI